ncbi:protein FAM200B [Trichonephila clavipes]|nr:protein FAM200B [Trichonephila clavipes]
MDKFLSRKRTFDDNKASTSAQTSIVPKIKSRKYSQEYLNFGFTITVGNIEEKPLCVICSKILAADSMKPNKLKRHFETLHREYINKPREFFESKLKSYEKQKKKTFKKKTLSVNEKALFTSYKVSYKIVRCKKPHTIAEELILPAAIEIVDTMFGDNFAKELQSIPLSNDTVSRQIDDIAEDVEQQLFGKLRDKLFSIQLDEATDSNKDAHFIVYVRFWDGGGGELNPRRSCEEISCLESEGIHNTKQSVVDCDKAVLAPVGENSLYRLLRANCCNLFVQYENCSDPIWLGSLSLIENCQIYSPFIYFSQHLVCRAGVVEPL